MNAQECSVALFSILLMRLNKFEFWHEIVYQELNDEQTCNLKFVIWLTIFHQTATNLRLGLSTESFMNMWRKNKKASIWGRRPAYLSHKNVQVGEAKTGFVGWHTKRLLDVYCEASWFVSERERRALSSKTWLGTKIAQCEL